MMHELVEMTLGRWRRTQWSRALRNAPLLETLSAPEFVRLTPIELLLEKDIQVVWHDMGGARYTEPFFATTVWNVLKRQRRWSPVKTGLDALQTGEALPSALPPRGFIFHVSRCGSTLLSNMIAASPSNLVLKEPALFNTALSAFNESQGRTVNRTHLRALLLALGHRRAEPVQEHLFAKFTSWNTLLLPHLRQAFPEVPFVFLYRDPLEVASAMLDPVLSPTTLKLLGLLEWLGMERLETRPQPHVALGMGEAEYAARLLGKMFQVALDSLGQGMIAVNYTHLAGPAFKEIMRFYGLSITDAQVTAALDEGRYDAKNRRQPYQSDVQRKRRSASRELREQIERWAMEPYRRLEALALRP